MIEFVLDCSVAISWCLVDEDNDYANAVLDIMPNAEAFVPEIWSLEIVNTLPVAERRNRMTVEQTQASINWLQSLLITIDSWLFGLCYAMDGGYKGWNPYIERHLAIFVNCF